MTDSNGLTRRVARMSEAFDRLSKGHGSGEDIALLDEYQRSGQWLKLRSIEATTSSHRRTDSTTYCKTLAMRLLTPLPG